MVSSSFYLSGATVLTVIGLGLFGVAVFTNNWTEYTVNRREIINAFNREPELNVRLKEAFTRSVNYFSRTNGLFQTCFPDAVPSEIGSHSYLGSPCISIDDYFPSEAAKEQFNNNETTRLWLMRASVILFICGISAVLIGFFIGIFGCWKQSYKLSSWTAMFFLLAGLCLAGGMGCWQVVSYMENHQLETSPFYKSWEPILKSTTRFNYGYSYIVSWAGIFFLLTGAIAMWIASRSLKREEEMQLCAKQGAYMLPNFYEKSAMVPYGYNTFGGYAGGGYPYYNTYGNNGGAGYYGYMTYGGHQ